MPVGAVVTKGTDIIAEARNSMRGSLDPTAHAEIVAIREAAARLGQPRLDGCIIWVTLEPCAMCAGAMVLSRLRLLVFGAWDEKAGMAGSVGDIVRHPRLNHRPEVVAGVLAEECGGVLREFFGGMRNEQ